MSFQIELDKYDEAYGHFMREIRNAIQDTFAQEAERRGLTQADVARELKIDSSVVSRRLNGAGNVTLRTICDLYTAMGREPLSNFAARGALNNHQLNEIQVILSNSLVEAAPIGRTAHSVDMVHTAFNSRSHSYPGRVEVSRHDLYPVELTQTRRMVHHAMRASVNAGVERELSNA